MNIVLGDDQIVSIRASDAGSKYDARAVADAVDKAWADLSYNNPMWVRQGPNYAKHSGTGEVRNLYNMAISNLDLAPVVSKQEVMVQTDNGDLDRYLLTPDEVLRANQTGILPKSANVSARFNDALSWTVEGGEAPAKSAPWGLALAAVAAYLAWKG